MYVVISGRARVDRVDGDTTATLAEIGRGDVIGEMGLIRRQPRVANVTAVEDVELLVVNEKFLTALQEYYPSVAATIYRNLSHILSDRLEMSDKQRALAYG
jgi:CRP-like cAMP-binding protein